MKEIGYVKNNLWMSIIIDMNLFGKLFSNGFVYWWVLKNLCMICIIIIIYEY